jgi:hypothetical protein
VKGRILSQDEIDAMVKFCGEHNLAVDGPSGSNNGKELAVYIVDTWKQRITPATLAVAVDMLKDRLTFLSQAEGQYNRIAAENPAAAQQLSNWFAIQKTLVREGDQGFENQSNILQELRGHPVTSETIQKAIASIGATATKFHAARRPLHFVQAPRRTEPISPAALAAQSEDPDRKPGQLLSASEMVKNADGSYRSKTPAEQRAEQEAIEASKKPAPRATPPDAWEQLVTSLLSWGVTHSQRQNMRETYEHALAGGKSWRETYTEMSKLKRVYERGSYA